MNIINCRPSRKLYRRIIFLLILACLLTTPVTAQQVPSNDPQSTPDNGKTPIERTTTTDDAPELTVKAAIAIDKGLKHLLTVQKPDGSWDAGAGKHAVSSTSLALMAFMSKAQFPGFGPYAKQLDRGKDWLLEHAKERPDGYLGDVMYEHGMATLALSEMWGMTRNTKDDDAIQEALEKAVEVILRSQNPGGGWRYQPQADGGEDTSCTMTIFHALASARQAGIMVPNETIAKLVDYLEKAKNLDTGGFCYSVSGIRGNTASYACSAGGAYSAQLAGQRDSEMVAAAIRYLKKNGVEVAGRYYYYSHYYAIQAMVQAGDEHYAEWYPLIRDSLIRKQGADGSWGPGHKTPMAIIILATPHRYIPIYQR